MQQISAAPTYTFPSNGKCGAKNADIKSIIHLWYMVVYLPCNGGAAESLLAIFNIATGAWQADTISIAHNKLHSWNGVVSYATPGFVLHGSAALLFGANSRPFHILAYKLLEAGNTLRAEEYVKFTSPMPSKYFSLNFWYYLISNIL